ncbi:MAG TPA: FAD-dependent oxidoreductase [Intrasporangium sp.]|uniref:FAD-dependent oxidoreductase n=1 Tax=Intrasporangium sp. TaxID=1925024 RepID=UPI002D76D9D4|nr:FAD-dependent oxidoreductase [Intrasporangium sp.]HET7400049.1 FAD-dependent oxidoreductase [Intrasporangium sp.]
MTQPRPRRILVVGNGMAGARLAEELRRRDPAGSSLAVTVVGEEPHAAYNRVLLSTVVAGAITPRETRLKPDGWWEAHGIDVRTGTRVASVDVEARTAAVCRTTGPDAAPATETIEWDELVLATGSSSFVPPVAGIDPEPAPGRPDGGVVAFRTVDDCARIVELAEPGSHAVVLGGGLLGLEAARGLLGHGVDVTIVHPQHFPMDRQLDADGGAVLARVVRRLGARLVLGHFVVARQAADAAGGPRVVLDDDRVLPADLVVVAAGVRPRVDLAASIGVEVNRGIVVDDRLATSLPHVHAIGECAEHRGEVAGLVQPCWEQAQVLADVLSGAQPTAAYTGTTTITRLKAHDIDLASMGDVETEIHDPDHEVLAFTDPSRGRYAKLVLRQDRLVGAILLGVGDASGPLTQLFDTRAPVPRDRLSLLLGRALTRGAAPETASLAEMPGSTVLCRCNTVTKSEIVGAWQEGAHTVPAVAERTRATTGCGGCSSAVQGICDWLRSTDVDVRPEPRTAQAAAQAASTCPEPRTAPAALTEGAA